MSKNLEGAVWALAAAALYAVSAALGKFAANDYHILQILFFRQIIVFLSVLPIVARNFPDNLKTQHPLAHGFRLGGAFIALSMGLWAVSVLPLAPAGHVVPGGGPGCTPASLDLYRVCRCRDCRAAGP